MHSLIADNPDHGAEDSILHRELSRVCSKVRKYSQQLSNVKHRTTCKSLKQQHKHAVSCQAKKSTSESGPTVVDNSMTPAPQSIWKVFFNFRTSRQSSLVMSSLKWSFNSSIDLREILLTKGSCRAEQTKTDSQTTSHAACGIYMQ